MSEQVSDNTHGWRYGNSRQCPAPEGILVEVALSGRQEFRTMHDGRIFYKMTEGHLHIIDPANGGHSVGCIERGLIRRVEISAI